MKNKIIVFILLININIYIYPQKTSNQKKLTVREKILHIARKLINFKGPYIYINKKKFKNDCSGFTSACYYYAKIDLVKQIPSNLKTGNLTKSFYLAFKAKAWKYDGTRMPQPGDLLIFHNTYDKNKNSKWDDYFTHVGIVEYVDSRKTISYIHKSNKCVERYYMNLNYPDSHVYKGKIYNSYLRRRPKWDKNRKKYLSSKYFAYFICALK